MHLGLWPTYSLGQAETNLLFASASAAMAAAGGAILASQCSRSYAAGAGVALLAILMFVVLRLGPGLAGSMILLIDGIELVAVLVDFIALCSCVVMWLWEPTSPIVVVSNWPDRPEQAG